MKWGSGLHGTNARRAHDCHGCPLQLDGCSAVHARLSSCCGLLCTWPHGHTASGRHSCTRQRRGDLNQHRDVADSYTDIINNTQQHQFTAGSFSVTVYVSARAAHSHI